MSRIKLEFEKGGTFFAELLDQEAPRTCATFLAQLPAEIRFRHSMICGQAIASVKLWNLASTPSRSSLLSADSTSPRRPRRGPEWARPF